MQWWTEWRLSSARPSSCARKCTKVLWNVCKKWKKNSLIIIWYISIVIKKSFLWHALNENRSRINMFDENVVFKAFDVKLQSAARWPLCRRFWSEKIKDAFRVHNRRRKSNNTRLPLFTQDKGKEAKQKGVHAWVGLSDSKNVLHAIGFCYLETLLLVHLLLLLLLAQRV